MSTIRLFLALAAVATGTLLMLLLASDAIDGNNSPSVWSNLLSIVTAVLVLTFISVGNRERMERRFEESRAEDDLVDLRGRVRSMR